MHNTQTLDNKSEILSIYWEKEQLFFLDQTRLPVEVLREQQTSIEDVWHSIQQLKVRGAPAIGVAGAYGLYIGIRNLSTLPLQDFLQKTKDMASYLNSSRPTAVNLSWGLKRMLAVAESAANKGADTQQIIELLKKEAEAIHQQDIALCQSIGEAGLPLIREGMGIHTHCNAGALATSGIGTATAPMYLAHQKGISFRVYADETRPLLQGARLTSWELHRSGIDVTLICDNMAASLMSSGKVDMVIVGTDRVAANGDVANKIGTYGLALIARHFNIPFYVACPSSTVDVETPSGATIPIEERDKEEVTNFGSRRTGPKEVSVWNPAFDVTPAELVSGIITEKGILKAPFTTSLQTLLHKN